MNKSSRIPLLTTIAILLFFYIPIAVLIVNSFNASSTGGSWEGFTLKWYERLFSNGEIWDSIRNSLIVGVTSTLVSTILGTCAAFALYKYSNTRLQKAHSIVLYMPLVVPEILMGISLLMFFIAIKLPLGLFAIFVAHVTFSMSYVAMVVLSRLQDFDATLLEAAMDLGANAWVTARKIMLPLIAPGIIAGGLLAFTLSVDDFVIYVCEVLNVCYFIAFVFHVTSYCIEYNVRSCVTDVDVIVYCGAANVHFYFAFLHRYEFFLLSCHCVI